MNTFDSDRTYTEICKETTECSRISIQLQTQVMDDHYILERYLSNSFEDEEEEVLDKVPQWSVDDVCQWLSSIGFSNFVDIFRSVGVDGDILLLLKDSCIKDDLEMSNGILRKRFQRELKSLKRRSDYSCCVGGEETAAFLSSISPDFREFTYNMISKDMTVEYMRKLSWEDLVDMLREAGVDNMVHQHKIYDALCSVSVSGDELVCSDESSVSSLPEYDVYVTHPRDSGAELASLIKMQLELRGLNVFLSNTREGSHCLSKECHKAIQNSKHFVLVLVPGALDSCKIGSDLKDKIREEITTALKADSKIVPVNADFQWPAPEELEPCVREVAYFNGVRWVHEYQKACLDKLEKFTVGDTLIKVTDSPLNLINRSLARSRRSSGRSTPLFIPSRRASETPMSQSVLTNMLMVPRNLRRSNLSIISNDSGHESHYM